MTLFFFGLLIFGVYPNFNGQELTKVENILYQSFSRPIWGSALSFIIYTCVTGNSSRIFFNINI